VRSDGVGPVVFCPGLHAHTAAFGQAAAGRVEAGSTAAPPQISRSTAKPMSMPTKGAEVPAREVQVDVQATAEADATAAAPADMAVDKAADVEAPPAGAGMAVAAAASKLTPKGSSAADTSAAADSAPAAEVGSGKAEAADTSKTEPADTNEAEAADTSKAETGVLAAADSTADGGDTKEESKAQEVAGGGPSGPRWEKGSRAQCKWDETSYKVCEILDIRQYDDQGEQKHEYYVHFVDFDRRLDDWVREDRMSECVELSAADQAEQQSLDAAKETGFLTRNQRRRMEEAHIGEAHPAHEAPGEGLASSIQAQMEKEHFENTKVKNIRCAPGCMGVCVCVC
jgi:hypothetical protein